MRQWKVWERNINRMAGVEREDESDEDAMNAADQHESGGEGMSSVDRIESVQELMEFLQEELDWAESAAETPITEGYRDELREFLERFGLKDSDRDE